MFVRRRGCRLQVIRSYRDDEGKPRHETLGVVGVFDRQIDSNVSKKLSPSDRSWLRSAMQEGAAEAYLESCKVLDGLCSQSDNISKHHLMDEKIYDALAKLAKLIN